MITIIDNNDSYSNHYKIYDDKDDNDENSDNDDTTMNAQITRWIYMEGF